MSRRALVEGLADRYYARVLGFARQLTDTATAEDVTQEVFTRLMSVEGLEDRVISVSYLLKAAHNLVRGLHRKQTRQSRGLERLARRQDAERGAERGDRVVEENATHLERCFDRLAAHERDALRLTVCSDLSLRDASTAMGVRVTTLTNWKYRALRKLGEGVNAA